MRDGSSIDDYLDQLASAAPTPGGGSVAGLVAALAAGLGSMVCALTRAPMDGDAERELSATATFLDDARTRARAFSARDETAYGDYIAATRLPKTTHDEKMARREAIQAALRTAAEVPLQLAELCVELLSSLRPVVRLGNPHLMSDARIAVMLAETAHRAALVNVRVNLALMRDRDLAGQLEARAQASERRTMKAVSDLERVLETRS
jgi:formiminotetrahydrofolate cyclodeaminase